MVESLLNKGLLDVRVATFQFMKWYHGFDVRKEADKAKLFRYTTFFPNLPTEFRFMLEMLGPVLESSSTMASRVARSMGPPSAKILGNSMTQFPDFIKLPRRSKEEELRIQRVLYLGRPNQCFLCKKLGHIAKDCAQNGSPSDNVEHNVEQPTQQDDEAWEQWEKTNDATCF